VSQRVVRRDCLLAVTGVNRTLVVAGDARSGVLRGSAVRAPQMLGNATSEAPRQQSHDGVRRGEHGRPASLRIAHLRALVTATLLSVDGCCLPSRPRWTALNTEGLTCQTNSRATTGVALPAQIIPAHVPTNPPSPSLVASPHQLWSCSEILVRSCASGCVRCAPVWVLRGELAGLEVCVPHSRDATGRATPLTVPDGEDSCLSVPPP
jgi:hypothetical protein